MGGVLRATAFADFVKKMQSTPDGQGSLLDHALFMYGSNMSNSKQHSNYPIPNLVVNNNQPITVPADKNEAKVEVNVNAGAAPGTYNLELRGSAAIPFNKDPMAYVDWGQSKFFTLDDMGEGECAV